MPKILKELYLASLGIMSLTYEKAREISNDLIKKGELTKKRQQKFITDLLEEARKNTTEVSKIINEKIDYLVQRGKPLKKSQDKLVKDLKVKAKKTKVVSEERINHIIKEVVLKEIKIKEETSRSEKDRIEEILDKLNIPTKEDLEEIHKKLDMLIKEIR
ncbi:MAG: hypothetical protein MUP02_06705 [Actinobacteria bacterium]|nr:hypothetical protein [Actinomycetota bacterium]